MEPLRGLAETLDVRSKGAEGLELGMLTVKRKAGILLKTFMLFSCSTYRPDRPEQAVDISYAATTCNLMFEGVGASMICLHVRVLPGVCFWVS